MKKLWLAICLLFVLVIILAYTDYKDDQYTDCVIEKTTQIGYRGAVGYCNDLD